MQPARSTRSPELITVYRPAITSVELAYPEPVFQILGGTLCQLNFAVPKTAKKLETDLFHKSFPDSLIWLWLPLLHQDPSHLT